MPGKDGSIGVTPAPQRRLTALVHADVVGFGRLIGRDDAGTSSRLRRLRAGLIEPLLLRHAGTLVNTAGDAFLLSFESVTAAVRCAVELQNRVPEFDEGRAADQLIRFRVGIDLGDILASEAELLGEGVNVAARLQAICPSGGVCVSRAVHDHVRRTLDLHFVPLGPVELKNISQPVEAFVLRYQPGGVAGALAVPGLPRRRRARLIWLALLLGTIAAGATAWEFGRRHASGLVASPAPQPGAVDPASVSIAVLPFTNLSGDAEQAYLADGIAEDLTTDLSQLAGTTVIARESAFSYKGKQIDVREVGRQLGVRYVIEGSVRKLGEVVRVNAQLVSAETGAHLWAERFDKPVRELEGGMTEIVGRIGTALHLKRGNPADAARRRTPLGNPDSFDLVLRARSVLNEPGSDVRDAIARGLFEQALRVEPSSVPAMAGVAAMLVRAPDGPLRRASSLVTEAESRAAAAPEVLAAKFLLLRRLRRWAESVSTFRQLLETDSSAAGVALQAGRCPRCWGAPADAIPLLERTALLNPRSPNSATIYVELGRMLILTGRDDDAIRWLERARSTTPGAAATGEGGGDGDGNAPAEELTDSARLLLGAAYALKGQLEAARASVAAALRSPGMVNVTLGGLRRSNRALNEPDRRDEELRLLEGLRLAGLRERLDESADSHVASDARLRDLDELNGPTPMSVPGGTTIDTDAFVRLLGEIKPVLITTASSNPTIPGAVLMPVTYGGTTADEWQARLERLVRQLTGGDRQRPVVTFGSSINRWHARNVALRLIALGYTRVYWYRGGVEAWASHGLAMAPVIPAAR